MLFQLQYMQPQTPSVQSAATIIYKSPLTHLRLDKMATISQTIFPKAFSWMKNFVFWLKFHWRLSPRVQLAPNRRQAIIWTSADPINWRIYATLGGYELTHMFILSVCKSLSTVWAPESFIHQETYEHIITQNLTNYMPQISLIANYKNILDLIMKQLLQSSILTLNQHLQFTTYKSFATWVFILCYISQQYSKQKYNLNSRITMQNPYCICRLQFIIECLHITLPSIFEM